MESSGVSLRARKHTPLDMFYEGVAYHKERFGSLPYRVTLSADWKDVMQHATVLVVEGSDVLIGYRRGQDRQTVSTQHTKRSNQASKK